MKDSHKLNLRRDPLYRQISNHVRNLILTGEVQVGEKLPPMRVLAERWRTNYATVHAAMGELVELGMLERAPKRGTTVKRRYPILQSVGVYFGRNFWHDRDRAYSHEVYRQLVASLKTRQVICRSWVWDRVEEDDEKCLEEIARAASSQEIQGLIVGVAAGEDLAKLEHLNLPMAIHSSSASRFQVSVDTSMRMDMALRELKRLGCRSVGTILPFPLSASNPSEAQAVEINRKLYQIFTDRVADFQLTTRNSWVRLPSQVFTEHEHRDFGYREFREIWKQSERPDGLLIYPDTIVSGAILAMMQEGVSVPQDLRLVLHRNTGIPVLCPLPASWIVTDVEKIAQALIFQIERQLGRESPEPLFVEESLETAEPGREMAK